MHQATVKAILVAIGLAGAAWRYFSDGRISRKDLQDHYIQRADWVKARDREALCDSVDAAYAGRIVNVSVAGRKAIDSDKKSVCADVDRLFDSLQAMDGQTGGKLRTSTRLNIESMDFSADNKTATVKFTSVFSIGVTEQLLFRVTTSGSETFVERRGRLYRTAGDTTVVSQ